jgi:RNAse (barnase) inhibitor barstar
MSVQKFANDIKKNFTLTEKEARDLSNSLDIMHNPAKQPFLQKQIKTIADKHKKIKRKLRKKY